MKKLMWLMILIPVLAAGCASTKQCARHDVGAKCETCCKGSCDQCCKGNCATCEDCGTAKCC